MGHNIQRATILFCFFGCDQMMLQLGYDSD
jgi:hypothetical protein